MGSNKRRDGVRVRGLDGYHNILPYVMPKRTEAEVSLTEQFDVTDLVKYMAERNEKREQTSSYSTPYAQPSPGRYTTDRDSTGSYREDTSTREKTSLCHL